MNCCSVLLEYIKDPKYTHTPRLDSKDQIGQPPYNWLYTFTWLSYFSVLLSMMLAQENCLIVHLGPDRSIFNRKREQIVYALNILNPLPQIAIASLDCCMWILPILIKPPLCKTCIKLNFEFSVNSDL